MSGNKVFLWGFREAIGGCFNGVVLWLRNGIPEMRQMVGGGDVR